jgi:hypothetical protein
MAENRCPLLCGIACRDTGNACDLSAGSRKPQLKRHAIFPCAQINHEEQLPLWNLRHLPLSLAPKDSGIQLLRHVGDAAEEGSLSYFSFMLKSFVLWPFSCMVMPNRWKVAIVMALQTCRRLLRA